MTQYIPKSALVAEIEKRKKIHFNDYHINRNNSPADYGACNALTQILAFINTLEVKEVDLEKELVNYHNENFSPCNDGTLLSTETGAELTWHDYECIAKHFFELGLNAQYSSINIPNIDDILEEEGIDPFSKEAKIFKESYYMALEKFKEKKGEKL